MSFYEHQHKARRKTAVLFGYFFVAVILIIVAVNAVVYFTLFFSDSVNVISPQTWITSPLCWGIAGITLAIILGGSLVRHSQIRGGGDSLAIMAGGRLVQPDTKDSLEKRLLNIAEEMAIASGTHIPRVYVLDDESGINAFVAGYNANNTILAVTKGALQTLTRDELQGVIGHEFSHVLNSDTRINLNLISILAGILLIGQIGEMLLRGSSRSHYYSRSSRDKNSGGQMILGLALMAIGYIGLFFGRLIKAAVSRQREFLADASAVQFTRNPFGIGGALFKIGAHQTGSHLNSRHAEDMSHMCFGETLKVNMASMLATHPPINQRLNAIDPSLPTRMKSRFNKGDLTLADGKTAFTGNALTSADAITSVEPLHTGFSATTQQDVAFTVDTNVVKESVGTLTPEHVEAAHQVHEEIPTELLDIAHQPELAGSIIYGLILTTMNTHGKNAIALIKNTDSEKIADKTTQVYHQLRALPFHLRLPILEIAAATLEMLSDSKREATLRLIHELIEIDNKFVLYEFIYLSLVEKYLSPSKPKKQSQIKSFKQVENAIAVLLSAIVLSSESDLHSQKAAFANAISLFSQKNYEQLLDRPPSLKILNEAVTILNRLSPLLKKPLVDTCVDCILHDHQVTANEANLLRAICERLDCPMPIISANTSSTFKG